MAKTSRDPHPVSAGSNPSSISPILSIYLANPHDTSACLVDVMRSYATGSVVVMGKYRGEYVAVNSGKRVIAPKNGIYGWDKFT